MALLPNLFMPALAKNSDALLQTGLGLLSGKTANEQAALGLKGFTQARKQNKTVDWLRQNDPELASAVEQGMLGAGDAFKMFYTKKLEASKPITPIEVNGRLVHPRTGDVIADFSDPVKPEKDEWLKFGDGNSYMNTRTREVVTSPEGSTPGVKDPFEAELKLQKDYNDQADVKTYKAARDNYQKIRTAAGRNDAQGDLGLVYGYMKMLDPGSVVREGEFATAANSGGIDEGLRNTYNSLINGQRLTPEQRQQFADMGLQYYNEASKNIADENAYYGDFGSRYQIDAKPFMIQPQAYEPLSLADMAVGETTTSPNGSTVRRVK